MRNSGGMMSYLRHVLPLRNMPLRPPASCPRACRRAPCRAGRTGGPPAHSSHKHGDDPVSAAVFKSHAHKLCNVLCISFNHDGNAQINRYKARLERIQIRLPPTGTDMSGSVQHRRRRGPDEAVTCLRLTHMHKLRGYVINGTQNTSG